MCNLCNRRRIAYVVWLTDKPVDGRKVRVCVSCKKKIEEARVKTFEVKR